MDGTIRSISYQWDGDGNRIRFASSSGFALNYFYDVVDRLADIRETSGSSDARFTYDAGGRRSDLAFGQGANTSAIAWRYDGAGRLQSLGHDLAGTARDVTLGYNAASQIVSEARSNNGYASNTAYDVTRGYSVNGLNQYTAAGPTGAQSPFGYDANGNLTSTPATNNGTTTYLYDAENRLVRPPPRRRMLPPSW